MKANWKIAVIEGYEKKVLTVWKMPGDVATG